MKRQQLTLDSYKGFASEDKIRKSETHQCHEPNAVNRSRHVSNAVTGCQTLRTEQDLQTVVKNECHGQGVKVDSDLSGSQKELTKFVYQSEPLLGPKSNQIQNNFQAMVNKIDDKCVVSETIKSENLNLSYIKLLDKELADNTFQILEKEVIYDENSQVKVFGKVHCVPRKQTAFGDKNLSYKFSGTTVPAKPWISPLLTLKGLVEKVTGYNFNFVLVNRYESGEDYIGEHRDDEGDLVEGYPIASLCLGQHRDFIFKHRDSRGTTAMKKVEPIKLLLEHGSLLMMNDPTNKFWYHSLPKRSKKTAPHPRINLTFRKIVVR